MRSAHWTLPLAVVVLCLLSAIPLTAGEAIQLLRPEQPVPAGTPPPAKQMRLDAYGEPLPDGALCRFGRMPVRHFESTPRPTVVADGLQFVSASPHDAAIRTWQMATGRHRFRCDLKEFPTQPGIVWDTF